MPRKPKVIVIDRSRFDEDLLEEPADIVRRGGLVIYPTDTVYGLGADPFNEHAVRRVYEVKRRPLDKPLPVLVSSIESAERLVVFNRVARRLAERFWPGPLTLVLPVHADIPCIVTACRRYLGVRIPADEVALALIRLAGGYLVGTSANVSGFEPPSTAKDAIRQLGDQVDVVIDAGPTRHGVSSTVVDFSSSQPSITRRGAGAREIEAMLASLNRGEA